MSQRWTHRPEGSNWGEFGADDQLGRLNLLTPEKVLQGVAEVKEGRAFCLSLPLDYPGGNLLSPGRHPPELRAAMRDGKPFMNYPLSQRDPHFTDVVCDDMALIYLQYSSQWDSLAHMGSLFDTDGDGEAEMVFYNGYRAGEHVLGPTTEPGPAALALGIETMAVTGAQGRGVLVDLHAHFGRARELVSYDKLMRVMEADSITVETGDMLCLHTGFGAMLLELDRKPDWDSLHNSCSVLDGHDERLRQWITESGIATICTDNFAVEEYPKVGEELFLDHHQAAYPLHEHCLFKLGLPLAELWYLTGLADWLNANNRSRFLLTAPPLRLPGAVGSPVTPVATV
jgi:kynurenine formamidase